MSHAGIGASQYIPLVNHARTAFLHRRTLAAALASLALALPAAAVAEAPQNDGAPVAEGRAPGEAALLGKLVAPCCWTQTLDVHSGATPDTLRAEIHRRLVAGETPAAIEADFVARYGQRVLAEPKDSPLPWVTLGVAGAAIGAAAALILTLRRWVRRSAPGASAAGASSPSATSPESGARGPTERDVWDDRLDDELRALDT